ncbi:hypothetical protein [Burkholderia multivorans]|uniref:beta-sandwich lipoprotein n=1 Tax=Burkholderia multivorans TaxID=87883 RepID=UPI002158C0E8|nr:hypothetical protein [Burkholderia multivorans]
MNFSRIFPAIALVLISLLAACTNDADVASHNLSTAADNFQINRRIVFYNGFTGEYILTIEGLCSKDNSSTDSKLAIICKTGPNAYPNTETSVLARSLGRPIGPVYQKAAALGLKKSAEFMASDRSSRIARGRTDPRMIATQFKPGHMTWNTGKKGVCA